MACGLAALSANAQGGLQPIPALSGHVIDLSGTIDAVQQKSLNAKLASFEAAHGSQVVVLVIHSTAPEDIASFANRVGNTWKIGRKDVGDGLLLVVAKDDHKLRIEVAKSLEGAIPDLAAKRVIDQDIAPRFKQGDFAGGLDVGIEKIMALIKHEALPEPAVASVKPDTWHDVVSNVAVFDFFLLALFLRLGGLSGYAAIAIFAPIGAVFASVAWLIFSDSTIAAWSNFGGMVAGFVAMIIIGKTASSGNGVHSGSSTGGGSSSSSGGGSFSSGGGGDFGGGGASGDW